MSPVASATTPLTSPPNSAALNIGATLVVASPANASARPGQLDKSRDRTRGHDDTKDGKQ